MRKVQNDTEDMSDVDCHYLFDLLKFQVLYRIVEIIKVHLALFRLIMQVI